MIDITDAITTCDGRTVYDWFISQEHLRYVSWDFDIMTSKTEKETYKLLYEDFLKKLSELYRKRGDEYYWFSKSGELFSDEGDDVVFGDHIRIDKVKLRELKLEELLK